MSSSGQEDNNTLRVYVVIKRDFSPPISLYKISEKYSLQECHTHRNYFPKVVHMTDRDET